MQHWSGSKWAQSGHAHPKT